MSENVRAVVMVQPGKIEMREFPYPSLEKGALIVRIKMSGICGTDKHAYKGEVPYNFPLIPGHENLGIVTEITKEASKNLEFYSEELKEGDRVIIAPDIPCGKCYFCKHSFGYTWCENMRNYGNAINCKQPPYLTGGWAEYMYVFPGSFVYKIPDDISDELAVLAEPMATTYDIDMLKEFSSLPSEGFVSGSTVVVQGVGTVGLCHLFKTRILGAGTIVAIDQSDFRLQTAKEFGADYTLNIKSSTEEERIGMIKDLTHGRGADVILDLSGATQAILEGFKMLRRGGTYLELGMIADLGTIPFNPYELCTKCFRFIGMSNFAYTGIIPSIKLLKKWSRWFPWEKIVSHKYRIEEAEKAIRKSIESDSMKVVIEV